MKKLLAALAGIAALGLALAPTLRGANIPGLASPDCEEASQTLRCINGLVNTLNAQGAQQFAIANTPRNALDNGGMVVQQRGTGTQTCAVNAGIVAANYAADRWACQANVAVGAGRMQVITSSPSPPPGFGASQKLFRTSGALTQPICAIQEIPTAETSVSLQGQQVVLSFYAQALAGLSADNGNVINATIIFGTGTDEGLGTPTASPAITPAWTGINSSLTQAFTITTGWVRYSFSGAIPVTATEVGVLLCFTPTATGSGATDGFAFTGAQLEPGTVASPFEFKRISAEVATAQRYYYQYADNLAATFNIGMCQSSTTTVDICQLVNPVTMRVTPTVAIATATSFAVTIPAGTTQACTTLAAVASSGTPNTTVLSCTVAANLVAGSASRFTFSNTGAANTITVSADF